MFYEQTTITGEIEITDSKTGKVLARKLVLCAAKPVNFCRKSYETGDRVEVFFPAALNTDEGKGTGPWEPGGYESCWLKKYAIEIRRLGRELLF